MLRLSFLIIWVALQSGCDQMMTQVKDEPSDPQAAAPVESGAGVTAPPASSEPQNVELKISVNAYGPTLTVKKKDSGEEVSNQVMPPETNTLAVPVMSKQAYEVTASLGGMTAFASTDTITGDTAVELTFSDSQLNDLRKDATCLLRIPGGGIGSGFLLGDRQTVATAAHCVACRNVEELEIVFNPAEPTEETVKGGRLIYFDAEQDVALLHLGAPVEETRPYYWRSRNAAKGDKIEIVGNPGRGGKADPMYCRDATVKGARADEYFVDIELKHGYSGGPHCLTGGMDAVGITSFKILTKKYEDDGKSFAKSIDIAADAFEHWQSLSSDLQEAKLAREKENYAERYGYFMANEAAFALYVDGSVYLITCLQVARDYDRHIAAALAKLSPRERLSSSKVRRAEKDAHEEFIKTKGPEKAKETKERLSPRLMMAQNFDETYNDALEDKHLEQRIKDDLKKAHEHYLTLKEAAENIVDPSQKTKRGKTLDEFIDYVIEAHKDLRYFALTVKADTERRLE